MRFGLMGAVLGLTVAGCSSEDGGRDLCVDTCEFAFDGVCDDGRPGAAFSACDLGTDCTDCGSVPSPPDDPNDPSGPPGPPDGPSGPVGPVPPDRTPPASGDFVAYARTRQLVNVITIGGNTSYKYAYQPIEANLSQGVVTPVLSSYERFNDQIFGTRVFAERGRVFQVSSSDLDLTVFERDPTTFEVVQSLGVRTDGLPNVLTVDGDRVYFIAGQRLLRATLRPMSGPPESAEPVSVAWPPLPSIEPGGPPDGVPCDSWFGASGALYCLYRYAEVGPPVCNNDCATARDFECQDGGRGSTSAECAYGSDCDDCAPRPSTLACFDSCASANNGRCEDGDENAVASTCEFGTDCADCGQRPVYEPYLLPQEAWTLVVLAVDPDRGVATERVRTTGLTNVDGIAAVRGADVWLARRPFLGSPDGFNRAVELWSVNAATPTPTRVATLDRRLAAPDLPASEHPIIRLYDVEDGWLLAGDELSATFFVFDLQAGFESPVLSGAGAGWPFADLVIMP